MNSLSIIGGLNIVIKKYVRWNSSMNKYYNYHGYSKRTLIKTMTKDTLKWELLSFLSS